MEIGQSYARVAVYNELIDYLNTHKNLHTKKYTVFSTEIIDGILEKIQNQFMQNDSIDLVITDKDLDDAKIKSTVKEYFSIDDRYMISKTKHPDIIKLFLYVYRLKAALNFELTEHMYFSTYVTKFFRTNPRLIEECIKENAEYVEDGLKELEDYYKEYFNIFREAYFNGEDIRSKKARLREISDKKNALMDIFCIDNEIYKQIIDLRGTNPIFVYDDAYVTKFKKDIIEHRILYKSRFNSSEDINYDDLILHFNELISTNYYECMTRLLDSGMLDKFPREKQYVMSQVSLEDSICENLFLGREQAMTLPEPNKSKCQKAPTRLIQELYLTPIINNIDSVMGTSDADYDKKELSLGTNLCNILFLKAIASIDPELESDIAVLIKSSQNFHDENYKTSARLIQNFMNLEYVFESEMEKIKRKEKDEN